MSVRATFCFKIYYVVILFACTINVSCNSRISVDCKELRLNDYNRYTYKYREFSGTCFTYHSNGNICDIISWEKGIEEGLRRELHPNGAVKAEYSVKNGLPEGEYTSFYINENLEYRGKIVAGKKEGEWKLWNNQGELIETSFWREGKYQHKMD
jgi:antitoxin component YwqK of YwqJK toxin-antitoxin module